jgi:hypothetical protein
MEVSGQLHAPAALPPGKQPLEPIGKESGWAPERYGHGGEEKNSEPLPALETLIIQAVAQRCTTSLSRFGSLN